MSTRTDAINAAIEATAQPTLADVTPVTEDANELRKRAVLDALERCAPDWRWVETLSSELGEPQSLVQEALDELQAEGFVERNQRSMYRIAQREDRPILILKQSGALVIAGRLTAVGERFAGIESSGQQITLSINTEQARWLGKYVGGEVKLTLEITP